MTTARRHVDLEVEAKIERLALQGWSPTQIHEYLGRDQQFQGRVPVLRTVQRKVADIRSRDKSRPWTLEDAIPDEAAAVLPVLAAVIHGTKGLVKSLSTAQVSYIMKIQAACPEIPPYQLFLFASLYVNRTAAQEPVDDLDAFLAYQPWDEDNRASYRRAVDRGWIRPLSACFSIDGEGKVTADAMGVIVELIDGE